MDARLCTIGRRVSTWKMIGAADVWLLLNHFSAEKTKFVRVVHMSSGWFDCTQPSLFKNRTSCVVDTASLDRAVFATTTQSSYATSALGGDYVQGYWYAIGGGYQLHQHECRGRRDGVGESSRGTQLPIVSQSWKWKCFGYRCQVLEKCVCLIAFFTHSRSTAVYDGLASCPVWAAAKRNTVCH